MGDAGVVVGIDVGGTFTDVVATGPDGAHLFVLKVPTTPDPADGVIHGLREVVAAVGPVASIRHGTTLVANALVERRGARTALITTRGFRDVLEIGRQSRTDLYDVRNPGKPAPLVPRHLRFEVTERVGPAGEVLVPLDPEEIEPLGDAVAAAGVEAVAICLLHAYANPGHERSLRDALSGRFPSIAISSDVNAEFREFERTSTTVLNAYAMPIAQRYLEDLERQLDARGIRAPVHIVQSNGGMMSAEMARRRPLAMVMSGPAAGVAAARHLLGALGVGNGIAFDMGGTTTDVCLIHQGEASVTAERRLGGMPVRLPSVAVESIGAGGGSVAWIDAAGALKVGPRSAAARPGPACYGLGGQEATVTDANLVLGRLSQEAVLGRTIRLDPTLAASAIRPIADRYGMSVQEAAEGIVQIANANMARALRLVSVQRGHDVREFTLVAYGGAGPIHAGKLAEELQIPRVLVPLTSSLFSAFGCLTSELCYDLVLTHRARIDPASIPGIGKGFGHLEGEAVAHLLAEGYRRERISLRRSLDLRYAGQNYEIPVPMPPGGAVPDAAEIIARFRDIHQRVYGYSTGEEVEGVNLRLRSVVPAPQQTLPRWRPTASAPRLAHPPRRPAAVNDPGEDHSLGRARQATKWHSAFFRETGPVEIPVYDRGSLPVGHGLLGPALVADEWSTTLVYPAQRLTVDPHGNLVIEVRP